MTPIFLSIFQALIDGNILTFKKSQNSVSWGPLVRDVRPFFSARYFTVPSSESP